MNNYAHTSYSPILPITFGAVPAAVVTALLVLLMHSLIASDVVPIDDDPIIVTEIIRMQPDPPKLNPTPRPPKPVEPVSPPEQLVTTNKLIPEGSELSGFFEPALPGPGKDIEVGVGGGGIVAYLRPQAVYPSRALTKGIEGHVDLAFDIAATGSTTNIRVFDAQPQGVFERAAVRALEKWKYKVPVIDNVPQGQVDMMTRMTFELEE